ncbi:MAG: ABC transporter permease subunit [Anaerolineae bacterium]|nr:ABC transporter permease subunit [Anaerolineae bacterium]
MKHLPHLGRNALRPYLSANPIVVKEMRSRMRGARAFVTLTGMLLLLGGISYGIYRIVLLTSTYSTAPLSPQIGQTLFMALVTLELGLICFLTPAITAGTISSEMENQTYEMLLATPLRPASILRGKLFSALGYILVLILAAVPLSSLVFIFGGVAPRDMLKALVVLLVIAVTLGLVGVFMSAWLKRTGAATVLSYVFVLLLFFGPIFFYVLSGVLRQAEPPRWILIPNPLSALTSAIAPSMPSDSLGGVISGISLLLAGNMSVLNGSGGAIPRPLYHYSLPLYGALSLGLYFLAVRLVQPVHRWRIRRHDVAAALVLLLLLVGAAAAGFLVTSDRYEGWGLGLGPTPVPIEPAPVVVRAVVPEQNVPAAPMLMTPTPVPPGAGPVPTPTPALLPSEQAGLYAVVIRALLASAQSMTDLPDPLLVYLLPATEDGLVKASAPAAPSRAIAAEEQHAIVEALSDVAAEFVWVAPREDQPGAAITLGNIHLQDDGSASVSATLYADGIGFIGHVYELEQVDEAWQLRGGE